MGIHTFISPVFLILTSIKRMYPYLGLTLLIMSDSYNVLLYNKDSGVKIIRNVCIIELRAARTKYRPYALGLGRLLPV